MEAGLARLAAPLELDFDRVDVDREPGLAAEYGERVPVVQAGDEVLCEGFLDEAALRERLASRSVESPPHDALTDKHRQPQALRTNRTGH
jgi:hypothetical protein